MNHFPHFINKVLIKYSCNENEINFKVWQKLTPF